MTLCSAILSWASVLIYTIPHRDRDEADAQGNAIQQCPKEDPTPARRRSIAAKSDPELAARDRKLSLAAD